MLLLLAAACLRVPRMIVHGRLWAEEATIFLMPAWTHPVLTTLLLPEFGYFSIWDNVFAALAGQLVPLEWTAHLFVGSAVLMLLVTGYFIYQAEFLPTRTAKTLGALALVLTAPSMETWLNLINSEFFFGILAAVLLFSDARRLRWQRAFALTVAVLSGPLTTLLAPFFVLRALLRRGPANLLQGAIVAAGALVQVTVALTTKSSNRKLALHPLTIGPVLLNKEVVVLFLDRAVGLLDARLLLHLIHQGPAVPVMAGAWMLFIACMLGLLTLLRGQRTATLLLLTALWFAVIEASLALQGGLNHVRPEGGERYAFTPNVLIVLALLAGAFAAAQGWRRTAARVLVGLAFLAGAFDYAYLPYFVRRDVTPWRQQVLVWRQNPSIALQPSPKEWVPIHLAPKPAGR